MHRTELLHQQGTRRIFRSHAPLFLHHLKLFAELVIGPAVVDKPIRLQTHHIGQAVGGNHLEVAGVVAAGEGVLAPPHGCHTARKLARRHAGRALEQHVLQHMGHAGMTIHLVHGADPHPEHVHGRGGASIGLDHQGQSVGQCGHMDARVGGGRAGGSGCGHQPPPHRAGRQARQ